MVVFSQESTDGSSLSDLFYSSLRDFGHKKIKCSL